MWKRSVAESVPYVTIAAVTTAPDGRRNAHMNARSRSNVARLARWTAPPTDVEFFSHSVAGARHKGQTTTSTCERLLVIDPRTRFVAYRPRRPVNNDFGIITWAPTFPSTNCVMRTSQATLVSM